MKSFFQIKHVWNFFLATFISVTVYGQNQLNHEKKAFQTKDKKTYWNKNLPVYIRISASDDPSSPSYLMKSDTSAKYADPYYFDTEGTNFIRTNWAVDRETKVTIQPKIEVLWEVGSDGIAPVSSFKLSSTPTLEKGKKFFGKNIEASLFAKDAVSGIEKIYYSINNEEYKEYTSSIILTEEKEYTIKYYSVDNVGNVEAAKTETLYLDLTPPNSNYSIIGEARDNTISGRARITIQSKDDLVGVSKTLYSLDNGKEKIYSAPIDVSAFAAGEHTIKFYSLDKVNNQEVAKEYNFYVDKSGPVVKAEILGDKFVAQGKEYLSPNAQLKLIAEDDKSGVKGIFYSVNGGEYQSYKEPFSFTGKGNVKVEFYAIDNVGNKSSSHNNKHNHSSINSYVDYEGPMLSYNILGTKLRARDTLFINSTTKIELKGVDKESGMNKILYSHDNSEPLIYESPFSIGKEGFYKLRFSGFDNVINSSEVTINFIVDNTGPVLYPVFDAKPIASKSTGNTAIDVYPSHVSLFLSATDIQLGYEKIFYSINEAPEVLYTKSLAGFLKGKDYKIKVRALDKLGNTSFVEVVFATSE